MKTKLLIFTLLLSSTWACNDISVFPDPTLDVQFRHYTTTDCCITTAPFANQDSIYLLQLDSTIIVSFVEDFLTNPDLIGGFSLNPGDFVYAFEISTNHGDREVFVSNRNINGAGSGSGDSQYNDRWYSEMIRDFIVPLEVTSSPVQDNATIELDPDRNTTLLVSYTSQFSDLSIDKEIIIRR